MSYKIQIQIFQRYGYKMDYYLFQILLLSWRIKNISPMKGNKGIHINEGCGSNKFLQLKSLVHNIQLHAGYETIASIHHYWVTYQRDPWRNVERCKALSWTFSHSLKLTWYVCTGYQESSVKSISLHCSIFTAQCELQSCNSMLDGQKKTGIRPSISHSSLVQSSSNCMVGNRYISYSTEKVSQLNHQW